MTLEGHVENGAIVLDDPTELPEGAKVRIQIVSGNGETDTNGGAPAAYDRIKIAVQQANRQPAAPDTLAQRYASALGSAVELPEDMAERHDHYIHGSDQ